MEKGRCRQEVREQRVSGLDNSSPISTEEQQRQTQKPKLQGERENFRSLDNVSSFLSSSRRILGMKKRIFDCQRTDYDRTILYHRKYYFRQVIFSV